MTRRPTVPHKKGAYMHRTHRSPKGRKWVKHIEAVRDYKRKKENMKLQDMIPRTWTKLKIKNLTPMEVELKSEEAIEQEIEQEAVQRWEVSWFDAYKFMRKMGWSEEKICSLKDKYLEQ